MDDAEKDRIRKMCDELKVLSDTMPVTIPPSPAATFSPSPSPENCLKLDIDDYAAFVRILASPKGPNERLMKLMTESSSLENVRLTVLKKRELP